MKFVAIHSSVGCILAIEGPHSLLRSFLSNSRQVQALQKVVCPLGGEIKGLVELGEESLQAQRWRKM